MCLLILLSCVSSIYVQSSPDEPTPTANHELNLIASEGSLLDAPLLQTSAQPNQSGASITGTITDIQDAVIPGATVTLEDAATHERKTVLSDEQGTFRFLAVKEGFFSITIEATGFAPAVRTGIFVHKDDYQLSPIIMQIAGVTSTIVVGPRAQYELAEAQIKAEEKQRLLHVFPSFYVSYIANPAPLTTGQKMRLAFRETIDPISFIGPAIAAGVWQARNTYPGYGQGASGFGKRYGAAYGNVLSGTLVGKGLVPALLHQDPRYFYKGTGSAWSRIGYAFLSVVRIKGDDGRWQPNYSGFVGDLAAGAISNSYLPAADRKSAGIVFRGAAESAAFRFTGALVQEFLSRWATTHAKDKGTIGHE